MGSTKMACMGPANGQETRYLAALQKAERYEVQGRTLLIHVQGMNQPLRFVQTAP
jgi:heat shock protein HslJ